MCRILTSFVIFVIIATAYGVEEVDFPCPSNDLQFFPDFRDCASYITCFRRLAFRQQCPRGLVFDPVKIMCNFPEEVDCQACPPIGIVTVKLTCMNYRLCVNGEDFEKECQPGTAFDEEVGECSPGHDCPFVPCVGYGNGSEIAFQRNPNCITYHICRNGEELGKRNCPTGSYFDNVRSNTCVQGEIPVGCITEPVNPPDETQQNPGPMQPPRPQRPLSFKEAQATISEECPEAGVSMISIANDCTKYAICANHQKFVFDCPMGTLYSSEHKLCTLPQLSNCQ